MEAGGGRKGGEKKKEKKREKKQDASSGSHALAGGLNYDTLRRR